jgi:hypothetical protein
MYEMIGRLTVKVAVLVIRRRYGRHIKIAAGVGVATALLGGYLLATRGDAPEG